MYKLGQAIISRKPADVDFAILSTTLLGEALSVDQTGSTQDYTDTLYILTKTRPEVWTDLYTAKKSVAKGLRQFLKKGSQGGPPAYWSNVERILRNVPSSVIVPTSVGEGQQLSIANDLLESLHDGIIKEAKASLPAAWTTYIAIAVHTSIKLTQDEDRQQLLKTAIIPLFEQFIAPKQDLARWSIGTTPALAAGILTDAFHQTMEVGGYSLLRYEWQRCAELLQDHIKTSHPEQSKDYTRSQDSVVAETNRWSSLTGDISRNGSEIAGQFLEDSSVSLVKVAMEVVKARNGKPYGAAATIEAAMRLMPSMLMENRSTVEAIARFLRNDVPSLIMSPCSPYLITVLCAFEGREGFEIARDEVVQALLRAPSSPGKNIALIRFLTSSCLQGSQHTTELHSLIFESLHKAMKGDQQSWELVVAAFNSPMTPSSLTDHLLTTMTDGLTIDSQASPALHGLRLVTQHSKEAIQNFTRTTEGSNLLPRLLFLTESASDDISQQAATVSVAVESTLSDNKGSSHVTNSLVEIISRELGNAGPSSLS